MTVGTSYTQGVYSLGKSPAALRQAEEIGAGGSRTKTMVFKKENRIIRFDPYTLEIERISDIKTENEEDPVYKKLKAAGLIEDDEEKADEKAAGFDEILLGAVRWHYINIYAMKRIRETVVKIEEDQMEEIFDRLEHNTGEELSTEGVTEGADVSIEEAVDIGELTSTEDVEVQSEQ
ncbi:MAG: hypothetical protein NC394_00735 [Bacteroides sp.]|nr:hypothetical protein [Bacteroides sp.]